MTDLSDPDRLTKLETTLTHHAKQIEELSDMVFVQGKEIDRLKRQLEITRQHMADMEINAKDAKSEVGLSGIEIAALNKPPHY